MLSLKFNVIIFIIKKMKIKIKNNKKLIKMKKNNYFLKILMSFIIRYISNKFKMKKSNNKKFKIIINKIEDN
jgi:hypothetical protein